MSTSSPRASFRIPSGMRLVHLLCGGWTALVFVFLYAPIILLVAYSFNASRLNIRWEGFTFEWYEKLWNDSVLITALKNSLIVASASTAISVVLGTAGAWLLYRYRFPLLRVLNTLIFIPMVIPEIIMGISLLILFTMVNLRLEYLQELDNAPEWFTDLEFGLGFITVIVAHVTFCFPFVLVAVQARLSGLDPSLEEAAMDLGASPRRAFWHIIVPYIRPAIVAGGLMAFTLSMDEFIVTYFTSGPESATLPLKIFGRVKKGLDPSINAISALFVVAAVVMVVVSGRLRKFKRGNLLLGNHRTPRMTTRRFICLALVALAALAVPAQAAKKKTLNIFCWSEYIPQSVIDAFAKEHNVKVNVENYASNEEMLAKLQAGGTRYDLIQPSEYVTEELVKLGKLAELNLSNIPNLKNIDPRFTKMPHDPEGKYSVPWMAGSVGIVVNKNKVKEPIKGFADVFQDKYKRRIVAVNDNRELVAWALAYLGLPINDMSPENLAKAKEVLAKWIPLVKAFDSDSPKTALLNGDVDLGVVWSGEAAKLIEESKKSNGKMAFEYVLPTEGAHLFVDNLAVPKASRNKELAEKFINYVLQPEVSMQVWAEFPYTLVNAAGKKLLSAEQLANSASFPPVDQLKDTFRAISKEQSAAIDKLVTDLKNE